MACLSKTCFKRLISRSPHRLLRKFVANKIFSSIIPGLSVDDTCKPQTGLRKIRFRLRPKQKVLGIMQSSLQNIWRQVRFCLILSLVQEQQPKLDSVKTNIENFLAATWVPAAFSWWRLVSLKSLSIRYHIWSHELRKTKVFLKQRKGFSRNGSFLSTT